MTLGLVRYLDSSQHASDLADPISVAKLLDLGKGGAVAQLGERLNGILILSHTTA